MSQSMPVLRSLVPSRLAGTERAASAGIGQAGEADLARRAIAHAVERAMEHPPRDVNKLIASVNAILLTNLEPAMDLARELRDSAAQRGSAVKIGHLLSGERSAQAEGLLT
ncbi:MAG: hypothetical protein EA377_01580 [Phycisphaerales bacterium]|nr:MAG: hypothetical protein EA377_01580 [Phycisphaerales bacterium]